MDPPVVAIVALAIKLKGKVPVVGGPVKEVDSGKLEGPGKAIGTTLAR